MADQFPELSGSDFSNNENNLGDRMIKHLLNSVVAECRELSALK